MAHTSIVRHPLRNDKQVTIRRGGTTQNVLACCSFDLKFQYFLSGADGASSDATLFIDACTSNLSVPPGKYYLADAGFPACDSLMILY
jgi:hypothetical protein